MNNGNEVEKQIEIEAPLSRVWQALTDWRQFGEWFRVVLEGPFVAGQPVGGQLTFPGYEHLRLDLLVQAIEPETYFSYTWHPFAVDPHFNYTQETPTLVEFRLEVSGGGTRVTVTESGFANLPAERRADAFRMNTRGWEQQLESLQSYAVQTP